MLETGTNGFKFQFIPSITNLQAVKTQERFYFLEHCSAVEHGSINCEVRGQFSN
jgi:hypothetical protein